MPGTTSGDVHTGLGKPVQGQTSGDDKASERHGLAGLASNTAGESNVADQRLDSNQRGLSRDDAHTKDTVADTLGAEEREPVQAKQL